MVAVDSDSAPHARAALALAIALTAALIGAQLWLVEGVRGVDQHWYLADVERLAATGEARTNTVFAGLLLRGESDADGSPIVHNGPLLHAVALLARVVDAFTAWHLLGLALYLCCAALCGLAARRLGGTTVGWLAYGTALLAPVAVWQAANVFQDTLYSAITALLLWTSVHDRHPPPLAVIGTSLALWIGTLSHPAFLVLGLAFAFSLATRRSPAHWVAAAVIVAGIAAAASLDGRWFPSSFPPTLRAIIGSSMPDGSNMYWHLAEAPLEPTPALQLEKLLNALRLQFAHLRYAPFNLPINAGLVALVALLVRYRRKMPTWLAMCTLLYVLYFSIIALMQQQPRYQMLVLPAALLCLAAAVRVHFADRRVIAAACALAVPVLAFDLALLGHVRATHRTQATMRRVTITALGALPADARLAFVGERATDRYVPMITALAPRPSLLLDLNLLDAEATRRALALFGPEYLVSDDEVTASALGGEPTVRIGAIGTVPAQTVYRVPDLPPSGLLAPLP